MSVALRYSYRQSHFKGKYQVDKEKAPGQWAVVGYFWPEKAKVVVASLREAGYRKVGEVPKEVA
jgi:hypothetical protein